MKRNICSLLLLALCLSFASLALAQDQAVTLKVGDPAPPLAGTKWLKGEPVSAFEPGKIYVIEFWATWCGPCKEMIPHVTEMQKKYEKDNVIFIGQDVWEKSEELVKPFVEKMGDKMNYRVVMDTQVGNEGAMAKTWMAAAGQDGIPCSFVVDKTSHIAWVGHPMELEQILPKVIAGTFDVKKNAAEQNALKEFNQKLTKSMRANDPDAALKLVDEFGSTHPDMVGRLEYTRFQILLKKKDYAAAYKAAEKAIESLSDTPQALNAIAWQIVDDKTIEKRDYDVAMKAATKANELAKGEDAAILDTLANVYFAQGQFDKAIEIETEAIAKANGPMKVELEESLAKFKKAKAEKPR